MDWIDLDQDKNRWGALVNVAINLWVHKMREISLLTEDLLASDEGLCPHAGRRKVKCTLVRN